MTGFVGTLLDAWDEVRVHRARVVLSLIGIVLAVFAMTTTTAAGMIFGQIVQEQAERSAGRNATLMLYASAAEGTPREGAITSFYDSVVRRYGVKYHSQVINQYAEFTVHGTPTSIQFYGVDPGYGVIHRIVPKSGRWLAAADSGRLAPSAVVNTVLLTQMGIDPARPAPFVIDLPEPNPARVIVVGTTERDPWSATMWMLRSDITDVVPQANLDQASLELWVPQGSVDQLLPEINRLVKAAGLSGEVQPPMNAGIDKVLFGLQVLIFGLSLFALFLGALGVLNVGVVTVRQRIREIGVRRALGASSGRIFAAVMLESVLATALAGLVGIAAAVAVVNNFPYDILPQELQLTDDVPFPFGAALQAFITAGVVGALVGLIPASVAVRAKVIDAIRY